MVAEGLASLERIWTWDDAGRMRWTAGMIESQNEPVGVS